MSEYNVTKLADRRVLQDVSAPSDDIIAELERLLERAKRGEVIGLAYVAATDKARIGTWFATGKPIATFPLIAGAHLLARRLEDELVG